jgi:phospholipid/cholesterol/gamma-HCH transport system permease protein
MKSNITMKKIIPVIKIKSIAREQSIKLSEKVISKTAEAHNFLTDFADFFLFLSQICKETFSRDFEFREFLRQSFKIGYKSLPLISVTGFIMGLVLTIQARPSLVHFGAVSLLPGMVAVSLIREMGPVITALICAGKIGSGMGAELGSMKVTEQIDAMEVSSTNPMKFLVVTRVLAATLMIPILVLYADALGMFEAGPEPI